MNETLSCRRGAFAGAIAAIAILAVCDIAPAAAAETMNACAAESGYNKRKLKEGTPVTVTGLLRIETAPQGIALVMLANEDNSCQVSIEGTEFQMQQAAKCGDGAKATVAGRITEEVFVPAVVPLLITCD